MAELYYTPPTDEIFNEIKESAISVWKTYDDTYGYATEKINSIKDITNIKDNCMHVIAMFDINNQRKLSEMLSDNARKAVRERMIDGGNEEQYIVFLNKNEIL